MIFEGSEKKFELTSYQTNLREYDFEFIQVLVSKANATIIKEISKS